MLPTLLQHLTTGWAERLEEAGVRLIPPLSAIQISGGASKDRKVTFIVLDDDGRRPALLLKLARTSSYQERLGKEHEALQILWGKKNLRESIPRPIGLFTAGRARVLIESGVRGVSLNTSLRRHERVRRHAARRDLVATRRWLRMLQQETRSEDRIALDRPRIEADLLTLQENTSQPLPAAFVVSLLDAAEQHDSLQLPVVGHHGDFWPGNLFFDGTRLAVIDWEDFEIRPRPLDDLFLFLVLYAQAFPWNGWRRTDRQATFRKAFLEPGWFSALAAQTVRAHLRDLNRTNRCAHLLFSLFLLDRSSPAPTHGEKRRQQAANWQERVYWYAADYQRSVFLQ